MSEVGVWTAILGGILSFLSPCVLPLVPGYLSYISGYSVESMKSGMGSTRRRLFLAWQTLMFILGFTVVFMIFGGAMGWLGERLLDYSRGIEVVAGLFIVAFGFFLLGVYRPDWLMRESRSQWGTEATSTGSFLMGFSFGFGWTPCIGPILGSILSVAAVQQSALQGASLLYVYSMSLGIPFLVTALLFDFLADGMSRFHGVLPWMERIGGVILIIVGVLITVGQFSLLAGWLTRAMPFLLEFG